MFLATSSKRLPCSHPLHWRPAGGGTSHMSAHDVSLIRQLQTGGCYSAAWHRLQVSMEHNFYSQTPSQARRHFLFHLGQTSRHCQAAEKAQQSGSAFWRYAALVGSLFGPKRSQLGPHLHTCCCRATYSSCRDRQIWLLLFLDWDKRQVPTQRGSWFKEFWQAATSLSFLVYGASSVWFFFATFFGLK